MLLVGRQFRLPDGHWVVLGRDQAENDRILSLAEQSDAIVKMTQRPGPTGLIRRVGKDVVSALNSHATIVQAAGLVVHYGRKIDGQALPAEVMVSLDNETVTLNAEPVAIQESADWKL